MKVEIQRNETSRPIIYDSAENAFTKGVVYCVVFMKDGKRTIHKYPISSLFRVVEDYNESKRKLKQE